MKRTTEFTVEQFSEKVVWRVDLQPFQPMPFDSKPQQECGRQSNDRDPTNEFDYSTHSSSNSKSPSNLNPAKGCIKNWLSISESV